MSQCLSTNAGQVQEHVAGDKVFVDYSGKKAGIIDPLSGEVCEAETEREPALHGAGHPERSVKGN